MTALQIDKALTEIVLKMYSECESRLKSVDKSLKTERKALQIELGMYGLCLRAGLLYYTTGTRESTLSHFKKQADKIFSRFPKILDVYSKAEDEEKLVIVASLRQEAFMRDQFSDKNERDYGIAKEISSEDETFELNMKISAMKNVYKAWEQWRKANGIYPNMF